MGAIATGGVRVLNMEVIKSLNIPQQAIDRVAGQEQAELERREIVYRGSRPPPDVTGKTVILVEHKLDVVRSLADRIIVLHQGQLVADGEPATVMASQVVQEAYLGVAAE